MIFRDSPEKHLYSDAVVWLAAIIRGLLFPLILTSIVGMDNKLVHIPADTRSAFPVISVQSPVSIQCCWQS